MDQFGNLTQGIVDAEAMVKYWLDMGFPGNAACWQSASEALQSRLLHQAAIIRLHGVTGRPREACNRMAGILAGYCNVGGHHV